MTIENVKLPNLPTMSSKATTPEIVRCFNELREYCVKVRAAAGTETTQIAELNRLLQQVLAVRVFGTTLNNMTVEENGFTKWNGAGEFTVDIDFPIVIRTTGVGIPTMATLVGDLSAPNWVVDDFNMCEGQEFIHGWKEGTAVKWHIHVITNGMDTTNRYLKFEVKDSWANFGMALTAQETRTSGELLIPAGTPDRTHLIYDIAEWTPTAGKIGGHVWPRLKRVAATGTAPTGNPFCSMLQLHVLCDTAGSRTTTKK